MWGDPQLHEGSQMEYEGEETIRMHSSKIKRKQVISFNQTQNSPEVKNISMFQLQ